MEQITNYVKPELIVVAIALYFVGMALKQAQAVKDIAAGKPETFTDQLKPILSNERLFFTDLYKAGVGEKIEDMFREMLAGPGAVRATIHKYVG